MGKLFSKQKKEMNNSLDLETENLNVLNDKNTEYPFNEELKQKSDVFHFTYDYENGNFISSTTHEVHIF